MHKRCVVVVLAANDSHQGMLESLLIGYFGIACYVVPSHAAMPQTLDPLMELGVDAIIVDAPLHPLMNELPCSSIPTKTIVIPPTAYESPTLLLDELQPSMHAMLGSGYPSGCVSQQRYA